MPAQRRLTLVQSKELVMARLRLAAALLAALALGACTQAADPTSPSGPIPGLPGSSGGGASSGTPGDTTTTPPIDTAAAGDPVGNGTWTPADSTNPPTIQPLDGITYTPDGTGTAGTSGSSTALVFKTSGSGLYGVGTCGPNGFWTDPAGNVFGPNNPNCLDYGSDGTGNNGKGQCALSSTGQPGLWFNPGGQPTHPFHPKCLRTGSTTTALALSFTPQAQLFDAPDGSRAMNFYSAGGVVAQLVYHSATNTTTGAGILVGSDNASPANTWTIYFAQPALSYTTGLANGDLIGEMTGAGVEVVACSTSLGCSLLTLQLTLAP
jgi:hypothetical protein